MIGGVCALTCEWSTGQIVGAALFGLVVAALIFIYFLGEARGR